MTRRNRNRPHRRPAAGQPGPRRRPPCTSSLSPACGDPRLRRCRSTWRWSTRSRRRSRSSPTRWRCRRRSRSTTSSTRCTRPDKLVQHGLLNSVLVTALSVAILIPLASAVSFYISERGPWLKGILLARVRARADGPAAGQCCCRSSSCCSAIGLDNSYPGPDPVQRRRRLPLLRGLRLCRLPAHGSPARSSRRHASTARATCGSGGRSSCRSSVPRPRRSASSSACGSGTTSSTRCSSSARCRARRSRPAST